MGLGPTSTEKYLLVGEYASLIEAVARNARMIFFNHILKSICDILATLGSSLTVERLLLLVWPVLRDNERSSMEHTFHMKTNQTRAPTLSCFLFLVLAAPGGNSSLALITGSAPHH